MALNFPDSPTLNQIYTDTNSGFTYQWDGTVWQSYTPSSAKNIKIIDDIAGSFNGVLDTFPLTVSGSALTPLNPQQLLITLNGLVKEPVVDYTVNASNIIFTTPPAGGVNFSGVSYGSAITQSTIEDGIVTPAKLSTGGPSWNTSGDVYISGIITATSFSGIVTYANTSGVSTYATSAGIATYAESSGISTYSTTAGISTTSQGITGTPNISVGFITATSASFSGNVSVAGTLTYEDVTNVDSLGIVTARSGIEVGPLASIGATISSSGNLLVGIVTASGGFNLGISSSGSAVNSGPVKTLNFVGLGNTFAVNGTTIDISISGGGAKGGGTNQVFYENDQEVTVNYSITTGKNAMSAGPVAIATGITVTIPSGSTWTIV